MLPILERTSIDHHVQRPGIAVISWRDSLSAGSALLDSVLTRAAGENRGIRFGHVDTRRHWRLASEWGVHQVPSVMFFRDGRLLPGHCRADSPLDLEAALASAIHEE